MKARGAAPKKKNKKKKEKQQRHAAENEPPPIAIEERRREMKVPDCLPNALQLLILPIMPRVNCEALVNCR